MTLDPESLDPESLDLFTVAVLVAITVARNPDVFEPWDGIPFRCRLVEDEQMVGGFGSFVAVNLDVRVIGIFKAASF